MSPGTGCTRNLSISALLTPGKRFQLGCWADGEATSSAGLEIFQGTFLRRGKHERTLEELQTSSVLEAGAVFIL